MTREPVAIAAALRALLLCAVLFGLDWTEEQVAAVVLAAELVLGLTVRGRVSPL